MGIVWEALHLVTGKSVALKFLKLSGQDDGRAVQRFLREARAACAVRHPSVVDIHDVLEVDDGTPVMVMELLTGETLAQLIARQRPMPLPELAGIMVHVCSALSCAHALGIVHRDLKPENIFLAQSPAGRQVKVLDFGIAKLTVAEGDPAHSGVSTETGAILGTPYYMAPEQIFGEKDIDHRADVWALGIILYEALAGVRPTQAPNLGQVYKIIMTGGIVPIREHAPDLPAPVIDLVTRMLSRDRAGRVADVRDVIAALKAYTDESYVITDAPPRAPAVDGAPWAVSSTLKGASPKSRLAWRAATVLSAGFAIAVVGVLAWRDVGHTGASGTDSVSTGSAPALEQTSPAITSSAPAVVPSSVPDPVPSVAVSAPAASTGATAPSASAARVAQPVSPAGPRPGRPSPSAVASSPARVPPVDPGSYQ